MPLWLFLVFDEVRPWGLDEIFRKSTIPAIEFRASIIIGCGKIAGFSNERELKTHAEAIENEIRLNLIGCYDIDKKKQSLIIKETMIEDNLIIKKNGGRLYNGVIEGLRLLNQHYKMYIVSNCQKGYIEIFLNLYKLNDIFLDFECWGNTKKSKSDNIDMVKNRNQLQNPLYIGDTNGDMTAANKAHVKFYQLTYGFGDKIDEAISFPTFTDLVKNLIPN